MAVANQSELSFSHVELIVVTTSKERLSDSCSAAQRADSNRYDVAEKK